VGASGERKETKTVQKKDTSYWSNGIKDARRKRRRVSHDARESHLEEVDQSKDLDSFSMKELKEQLQKLGVPTRHFSKKRRPGLLKMLKQVTNSQ
jgi:hypothetical protein